MCMCILFIVCGYVYVDVQTLSDLPMQHAQTHDVLQRMQSRGWGVGVDIRNDVGMALLEGVSRGVLLNVEEDVVRVFSLAGTSIVHVSHIM